MRTMLTSGDERHAFGCGIFFFTEAGVRCICFVLDYSI
jgi:hypothetical protein